MSFDQWSSAAQRADITAEALRGDNPCDVTTHGGGVSLEGKIPTLQQKKDAGEIARETSGVKNVQNLLEVAHWP